VKNLKVDMKPDETKWPPRWREASDPRYFVVVLLRIASVCMKATSWMHYQKKAGKEINALENSLNHDQPNESYPVYIAELDGKDIQHKEMLGDPPHRSLSATRPNATRSKTSKDLLASESIIKYSTEESRDTGRSDAGIQIQLFVAELKSPSCRKNEKSSNHGV
jgi:hypothetical protein